MQAFDFSALLHALPDAVLVADMQGRIIYANPSVERVLGRTADALRGEHLHVIQPERMWEAHDAAFTRYAQTGRPRLFGTPISVPARLPDGQEREVELNLSAAVAPDGSPLVVAVLRDRTEMVDLERQLAVLRYLRATTAAAARLWTRLDPALVLKTLTETLVADFDSALARAWTYDAAAGMLHLVASDGLSTSIEGSSRAHIDVATYPYKVGTVARTRRPLLSNDLTGDPQFDQSWIQRERLRSVVCLPLLVGDDLLGVMVSFSRDPIRAEVAQTVTNLAALAAAALNDARLVARERAAREAADRARSRSELLAEISERLSASLDPVVTVQSVAEAVVPRVADWCVVDLLDDDHRLRTVASAHRDAARADDITALRAAYPPRDGGAQAHVIFRVINSGKTICETVTEDDLKARAHDARHLRLLRDLGVGSHAVATLRSRGRTLGAISFVRQPERAAFDAEDVATVEDVARRAALAIDNAHLYRSAQEAVELRDRFLAVASHELRTPLAVAYGHWSLLERWLGHDSGDQIDRQRIDASMRGLGHGIEQLRRLVEELLDVRRLSHSPMELRLAETDLRALIQQSVEDLEGVAGTGRVRLDLPTHEVVGMWDAGRLRQVIANLFLNAIKYSPHDTPFDVVVTLIGSRVRLRVSDTGIGIPADELTSIFAPFGRARNASAHHYPGLGLGLAVSREIVTSLGGTMWAESAGEGRGSSFVVELDGVATLGPEQSADVDGGAAG